MPASLSTLATGAAFAQPGLSCGLTQLIQHHQILSSDSYEANWKGIPVSMADHIQKVRQEMRGLEEEGKYYRSLLGVQSE